MDITIEARLSTVGRDNVCRGKRNQAVEKGLVRGFEIALNIVVRRIQLGERRVVGH